MMRHAGAGEASHRPYKTKAAVGAGLVRPVCMTIFKCALSGLNFLSRGFMQINKIIRLFVGEGLVPPALRCCSPIGVTRRDGLLAVRFYIRAK
jgi:hypothetical protein